MEPISRRRLGQLTTEEQLRSFEGMLAGNPVLAIVLERAAEVDLPGWYLTAGCLVQTVWNALHGIPATVEVRNQACVHLWYPANFGVPCEPFQACEDGVDSFAVRTCCIGTRRFTTGLSTYAPHGFDDVLDLVVRPNPALTLRTIYEAKTRRWSEVWPGLRVIPGPPG